MVLFPERIDGYYARLDRPFPLYYHWGWPAGAHWALKGEHAWPRTLNIWLSYSPDLLFWGNAKPLLRVEDVPWANHKLGPGAPPIRTDRGWLVIFHGAELTSNNEKIYRLGCCLLDPSDPSRILGMARDPILEPREPYELKGHVSAVVFTCGVIPEDNGELKIYYGGADACICLATAATADLLELCLKSNI